jgi:peptide-methionine (R)-S-oxide reductase
MTDADSDIMKDKIRKTEAEWKNTLSPERFRVLRKKGTEKPYSGEYVKTGKNGIYVCAGCGEVLFSSEAKYESGCGWPSFSAPIKEENVEKELDSSLGMKRTEVLCSRCGGHLGHVFDDGPRPTGKRYCINSLALELKEKG